MLPRLLRMRMNPAELAGQVSSHRPLQVQSRRSLRWATMDETHGRLLCDRSTRRKAKPYLGDACCTSSGPPDPEDRRHSLENKPSWYVVAKDDRVAHPTMQRFCAQRMRATIYEADGGHISMLSNPDLVIEVIREAADAVTASCLR